jgi:oxygen-dependent protoporphyrinogen oxidase
LKAIPYASALTVALAYEADARRDLPPGFGFLVPRKEKRRLLACTFVHNKFGHRAPPGKVLLRCFLGGSRDPEVMNFGDRETLSLVRQELLAILSLSAEPMFHRIHRWPSSMPQYAVGHTELVSRIQAQLESLPGLFLAGNAYSGIGISDSIRTGRVAAERALKL